MPFLNNRDRDSLKRRGYSRFFKSKLVPLHLVKIDRYLFFEFLKSCFAALLFFAFIYELTQLFYQMNTYMNRKGPFSTTERIVLIHALKLPYDIMLFSPLAFLFSTMFTLQNFYKNNEVVTVIGSGIHIFRFTLPILIFSLIWSVAMIFFGEFIMSPSFQQSEDYRWELDKQRKKVDYSKGVPNLKVSGEGGLSYNNIGYYDPKNQLMKDGIIVTRNINNMLNSEDYTTNTENMKEILENTFINSELFKKLKDNPKLKENENVIDRIVDITNITDPETQEIDIDKVFDYEVNTEPEDIYEKDKIIQDKLPDIDNKFFKISSIEKTNGKQATQENIKENKLQTENTEKINNDKTNNTKSQNDTTSESKNIKTTKENESATNVQPKTESKTTKSNSNLVASSNNTVTYIDNRKEENPNLDEVPLSIRKQRKEYNIIAEEITAFADDFNYDDSMKPDVIYSPKQDNKKTYGDSNKDKYRKDFDELQHEVTTDIVGLILNKDMKNYNMDLDKEDLSSNDLDEVDEDISKIREARMDNKSNNNSVTGNKNDSGEIEEKIKSSDLKKSGDNEVIKNLNNRNTIKNNNVTPTTELDKVRSARDNIIIENKTINNTESKIKNDRLMKDRDNIIVNDNQVKNDNSKNTTNINTDDKPINTDDLENYEIDDPDLEKMKAIKEETYVEKSGTKEAVVPSETLSNPIILETDNNTNINLNYDENSNEYDEGEKITDPNTIEYYKSIIDIDNAFDPIINQENVYNGRTINLRLDAECLIYQDDGWYAKCLSKTGKAVDSRAELWQWDSKGNLLAGYPKDMSGGKIGFIKDEPFHFEDNSGTKMETTTFENGLRIIEKLKKSGKVYKGKESELYGRKIFFPFASFIITLLGIGLGKFHTKKGMMISTFFIALMLFALYYVVYQIGESMGSISTIPIPGYLSPALGNIIFLVVGLVVISKTKT